ncbi:MAG TPA: response regulator transcription factor [Polyangia bacterium]|nr:response regulator transcription factor [Polyangia bacterium]
MKLLLVDSSTIFRMGLRAVLAETPGAGDLTVVGECADGATACRLAADVMPDVVVSGLHLADQNAIALVRELGRAVPSARVLILAPHGPEAIVHQALGAGAGGYALRGQSPAEVVAAIRSVGLGELVLPQGISAPPPRAVGARPDKNGSAHAIERLSQRERQIFDMVVWGSSNKQIAGRLGISIKTVETHRGHINGKLRVHTSADIVRLASLWGMLLVAPSHAPAATNGTTLPQ